MPEPLSVLRAERLKKLEALRAQGLDPFPARLRFSRSTIASVIAGGNGQDVAIAGRIRSIREHGNIAFLDIAEETGRLQVVCKKDVLGDAFSLLESLDIGDIFEVTGETFTTNTGAFSLLAKDYAVLSKSLRPLPSAWHGLKDVEERSRRRYVDLILNEESKRVFEIRSKMAYYIRKFLIEERDYIEVESPVLQPLYGGTRARPFTTHHHSLDMDLYLRISNELYLKRLIVGGFERVFEMGHTFRNEGMDRNHNPEFTMLETMHAYVDYTYNMKLVEDMFEYVVTQIFGTTQVEYQGNTLEFKAPWKRITVADLFKEKTGIDFESITTLEAARELASKYSISLAPFMTVSEALLEVFESVCVADIVHPTFIYDYPADFYPLAKRKAENPAWVESFDIYVCGMEMGTNYSEQNNPLELRTALEGEETKEQEGNPEAHKTDEDFIEAMEYAMPPTSGIGPGIDRWVMILTNSHHLRDVILFPTMKPRGDKEGSKESIEE